MCVCVCDRQRECVCGRHILIERVCLCEREVWEAYINRERVCVRESESERDVGGIY